MTKIQELVHVRWDICSKNIAFQWTDERQKFYPDFLTSCKFKYPTLRLRLRMESCIYSAGFLVGLINHQSEKSVQTENQPFLETYFVKDFFDNVNKQNICFERINARVEAPKPTDKPTATTDEYIPRNDTTNNGNLEFTFFEEQFKAHLSNLKGNEAPPTSGTYSRLDQKKVAPAFKYVKVDLKEKRYKCETCNKRFVNSSDFKRHLKIHTDEKLYVCNVCNKGSYIWWDIW